MMMIIITSSGQLGLWIFPGLSDEFYTTYHEVIPKVGFMSVCLLRIMITPGRESSCGRALGMLPQCPSVTVRGIMVPELSDEFYTAYHEVIPKVGFMSVCKLCIMIIMNMLMPVQQIVVHI
jgi:hypothetical protein